MWIKELLIKNFGKFSDKKIELSPGMNLIYGENESGKSTLHTFIRGSLYGMRRMRGRASKKDDFSHYQPWENSNYYAGNIRFVCGNKVFRLERDFMNIAGGSRLICETDGELLSLESGDLDMLLGGVGEIAFLNTVSIGQLKCETDEGLIYELQNYIANYQESGDRAINMDKALQLLKNQKKELDKQSLRERGKQEAKIRQISDYMGYLNDEIASDKMEMQDIQNEILHTERFIKESKELSHTYQKDEELDTDGFDTETWETENPNDESWDHESLDDESETAKYKRFFEIAKIPKSVVRAEVIILMFMILFCYLLRDFGILKELVVMVIFASVVVFGILWFLEYWSNMAYEEDMLENDLDEQENVNKRQKDSPINFEASKKMEKLYWKMENLSGEIEEKQTLVENCKQEILMYTEESIGEKRRSQKEKKAALELAAKRMQEVMGQMQSSTGIYLKKRTSEIFSEITNGDYTQVQIDDNLCTGVHTKERYVPLEQLSRGTIWQVYFAYRMAAAEILTEEESLPIMLDDAFVMYDEVRLAQVLAWLAQQDKQVLVFTCQKREKELLDRLEVMYHEVIL